MIFSHRIFLFACLLLATAGCATTSPWLEQQPGRIVVSESAASLLAGMREADRERIADAWIVVVATAAPGDTLGTLSCYSPNQWCWVRRFGPVPAVFGRNGIAPPGEKREGDGRTPSGLFTLTECFGYGDTPVTGLQYTRVSDSDIWVDDAAHPDYNRWVHLPTTATSFEYLKRQDELYRHAIVIDYNRDPVIPDNGSAIFIHIRRADGRPTAGCIGLSEVDLLALLRCFPEHAKPLIDIRLTP